MSDAPFTQRLKAFKTRLALDPTTGALVVKDQLLVPASATPVPIGPFKPTKLGLTVNAFLQSRNVKPHALTTVFAGLKNPGGFDDVAILKLDLPPNETVFSVTKGLREKVFNQSAGKRDKANASPNHVLVPAPNSDWCPYGGPSPANNPHRIPKGTEGVDITVIDSGYIWVPPSSGTAWGPSGSANDNPLQALTTSYVVHEAQWLDLNAAGTGATWTNGTHNLVDSNGDGKLDALAGHANFVAGVVAQHSELPNIQIWNHNSAFSYNAGSWDNFSTEAAVCRSLVMSQQTKPTPVIQIGHETAVYQNISSVVWDLAFARIGYRRKLDEELVLTCPAGNEGYLPGNAPVIPRIPAAFGIPEVPTGVSNPGTTLIGPQYRWIKGVASYTSSGPSGFSNHGAWVTCSANGEQVLSSFLYVNMPTEEAPWPPSVVGAGHNFKPDSWAMWNGTSFAAPQLAGEIAAQLSPSVTPAQAWANLRMCSGCQFIPGYGFVFQF